MPATPAADDPRDDWSRGRPIPGAGGYGEGYGGYRSGHGAGGTPGHGEPPYEFESASRRDPRGDGPGWGGRRGGRAEEPQPPEPGSDSGPPPHVDDPTEQVPVIRDASGGTPESPVPPAPVHRASYLVVAGMTGLLTLVLALGATLPLGPYTVVIFGVQVLFVTSWIMASRPPAPRTVAGVGLAAAAAADLAAMWVDPASLAPLAYVTAAAFVVGVVGQLIRPAGRERVTESLGSTLAVVVGVIALATLVVLSRHPLGTQSIVTCLVAAGVAVTAARLTDTVAPHPRLAPQVPRGGAGVLLGVLVGVVAAAVAGSLMADLTAGSAAAAGLVTALIGVVVDLSVCYAEAGRQLEGDAPAPGPVARAQGPLLAFALAAPVAYAASALLLVDYL